MSYFNHAFQKVFLGTGATRVGAPSITDPATSGGFVLTSGVASVTLGGANLGPGYFGFFNKDSYASVNEGDLTPGECCPLVLAAASLKANDMQGPFHGGYKESNKSKYINPRLISKLYVVDPCTPQQHIVHIGNTNYTGTSVDGVSSFDLLSLVGGTGYTDPGAVGVATTGGTGSGLLVDYVTDGAGVITSITISDPGIGYTVGDTVTVTGGGADATIDVATVDASVVSDAACGIPFYCDETYYLRIDVKGTSALRFANHNLYRTLDASGGCCADPSVPVAVTSDVIYKQFVEQIATDPYLKDFILPILVVDGDSFAYDEASAAAAGLAAGKIIANAPAATIAAGMILMGAYVSTEFGDCTFQVSDYYAVEPIQIFASEVDLNGDPCTFGGMCVVESCPGVQANGTGEEKVREVILSESYLQNFMSSDLRIREITQGTRVLDVLTRSALYSSFYILHSVPRFNNPSGTFDNDQYLLEVIGDTDTTAYLDDLFTALEQVGCISCETPEDLSQASPCAIPALPVVVPVVP